MNLRPLVSQTQLILCHGMTRPDISLFEEFGVRPQYAPQYPLGLAVLALLIVNLLGFAFVVLRAVFGWIASGYRPAP